MFRILLTGLVCLAALPALAQNFNNNLQSVTDLNRIQARQNPNYERAEKILTRRVIDHKNRVIGEVQDVIFKSNGGIKSLKVEFDRLNLEQPVYMNYHQMDIQTASRSYQVSLDGDQIPSIYPQLLADVETAAGSDSDEFSTQAMLNAIVVAKDGRLLGNVNDVLFAAEGDRVEALNIKLTQGAQIGKEVAIPLDGLELNNAGQRVSVILPNDLANAVIDFVSKR